MIMHHSPPGIQCAIKALRPDVAGIEFAETGYRRWIATDTRTLQVHRWKSFFSAYAGITSLIKAGHVLAVGIAQIKSDSFREYHVTLSTALDPCGAARALSNALQKNLAWASGAGFGPGRTFAAAASGYTSGQLVPKNLQTAAYVQAALYARARYMRRF
ncbi:lytic transglycosylase domain-containing protein [Acidithiobacillus ferrooxidans]|uniref:hypothetical protein n=1 Tax=Acidithiobacillus ferrooxidans TaxID=920 RepID=UPI001C075024|nr:hypothetical protein [Acidithiobacillus ferrooxidans]MBU2856939.1 lytic transglycosylase domain-containing protein [Acidithiobacillus ferrooxidans]